MLSYCDYAIFLDLSSFLSSMNCFDCLYDASYSQFEVYAHHQFFKISVETIVVQKMFNMEVWLSILTDRQIDEFIFILQLQALRKNFKK